MSTRVAIVTGGSRGIGRAVAQRLAADGCRVVVAYASNDAEASATVESIAAAGGEAIAVRTDVADEGAVDELFATASDRFGGVDVVVNAAGVMKLSPIADLDLDDFDRMVRTNLRGTVVVSRAAARHVRAGGAILNFSTSITRTSLAAYGAYAATKAAVEALGLILARELAGRDITVNTIAPGPTATELFLTGKDNALIERLAAANPMNRLGKPEDIAEVVSALAGDARWINGQVIFANGGMA
ncbi:3-oxoacyl-[acyl-carrier protein] reductase [Leifsonia sp. AK011]|uniref:SDR family oxidoreductase n=1 Tax=Leifsonia sp. AK011 TaxID=2723075 RepID=UPI0015CE8570|nr:SDR family oxidoreductase [Leifsonia sp. AK011]NYF09116.1 3-oxoacyl-[acyl-carrier protein] reductase [Leifsonia sp. AK011]